jgi:hypothetical protein
MKVNATLENMKYCSPACEIFVCEPMSPLCVSGVDGSGTSENYDETDHVWQLD